MKNEQQRLYLALSLSLVPPGIIPKEKCQTNDADEFRFPLFKNTQINGVSVHLKWCTTCQFYR